MTTLSPAERGIWAGHLLASDPALYNTAECLSFAGKVDAVRLEAATRQVVREAESLHSHYREGVDRRGERIPVDESCAPLSFVCQPVPEDRPTLGSVREWAQREDLPKAFALESEHPCRFTLFQGAEADLLYMAAHHVALDGFGYALFWQRLAAVYSSRDDGRFAPHQDSSGDPEDGAEARAFWLERLAKTPEAPTLSPTGALPSGGAESLTWAMPPELWRQLLAVATERKASWADLLLANVATLSRLYTGAKGQIIGTPILNRSGTELQTPCLRMNILPLRVTVEDGDDLMVLAARISEEKRGTRRHQRYRHEAMLRDLRKVAPRERLFGPVVNILPFAKSLTFDGVAATKGIICGGPVADLTLTIQYESQASPPRLEFAGSPSAWSREQLEDVCARFRYQLCTWLAAPGLTATEVIAAGLAEARRQHLLVGSGTPERPYDDLLEAVETIAQTAPLREAIAYGGGTLTYGELWARATTWAGALSARGVTRGTSVGVMLQRSPEAIVALLAVLRAGGCYVPLDPQQPADRLELMRVQVDLALIVKEDDLAALDAGKPASTVPSPQDPAYTLFTSGSTGRPKGIVISRGALSHFVAAANQRYGVEASDRVLQFAPFHFDTSLEEIFMALAHGATLVLRSQEMLDSFASFAAEVEEAGITVLDLPTAYWNAWVEALHAGLSRVPRCVRTVVLGGEAVHPETLRRWFALGVPTRLVNSYGPTETTIVAATTPLEAEHASWPALPIGRPLPGVKALVVGPNGLPARTGELLILGPTVGSRYLGTEVPLGEALRVGSEVLFAYATGDQVTLRNGLLVFLGRQDDEFKISGHRVHPREVESQLLRVPGIAEACVQGSVAGDGRRRLVAFVSGPRVPSTATIRTTLSAALPPPLVPSVIKALVSLPKTSSNKIDRAALALLASQEALTWQVPADGAERTLVERVKSVWREELGPVDLDEDANFFARGGQSLQVIQLALRLSQEFERNISVAEIFQHPVLADLCAYLRDKLADSTQAAPIRLVPLAERSDGPATYLFPGAGGGREQLADLAHHLARRGEVQLVEARLSAFAAVPDLAAACADLITARNTDRPVALVGHSFGGCIAYETARLLHERGLAVELGLLDTYLHLDRQGIGVRYRPSGRYAGPTRLIYAQQSRRHPPEVLKRARDLDAALFSGPRAEHQAPGNHFSMLGGDHAAALAELLRWT